MNSGLTDYFPPWTAQSSVFLEWIEGLSPHHSRCSKAFLTGLLCPRNKIPSQWSPFPLMDFQIAPRRKFLPPSASKYNPHTTVQVWPKIRTYTKHEPRFLPLLRNSLTPIDVKQRSEITKNDWIYINNVVKTTCSGPTVSRRLYENSWS